MGDALAKFGAVLRAQPFGEPSKRSGAGALRCAIWGSGKCQRKGLWAWELR